jgi:FAD/FMN-containing dehydrogenase
MADIPQWGSDDRNCPRSGHSQSAPAFRWHRPQRLECSILRTTAIREVPAHHGPAGTLVRAVGIEGLYPNALVISEWGPWIRARAAAQRHGDLAGRFGGDTGAADGGDKGAVAEIELMRRVKRALDPANVMNPGKLVSL